MDDHPLFPMIADIKQDIGKVIQGQDSLGKYIESVVKVQEQQAVKHDDHVKEELAHGIGTMVKSIKWMGGIITFVLAIFEFFMHKK